MRIVVLNGSPKGADSVTLQTVNYLRKRHPEHVFEVLHVGAQIRRIEGDPEQFQNASETIRQSDLLLFCYPVYTFLVPSQLHRFVELLKENKVDLCGKFVSQITTSKHFYDTTAHKFIEENCADLGMRVIRGLSADMDDLLTEKGRKDADAFFEYLMWSIENDRYESLPDAIPTSDKVSFTVSHAESSKKKGDVVIVADLQPEDKQLANMIEQFRAVFPYATRVVNLREFPFAGGCLGCFRCAVTGECVYKDGFDRFLREEIQTADAFVWAFTIRDHSMGSLFKMYNDREFCNGHRSVTMGKPSAYLISGAYRRESNLQMVINGRAGVGGNFLAGVASDECNPVEEIEKVAQTLAWALKTGYQPPADFLGVGGSKIFRDLIWLMKGLMKADHKFFRENDLYDFPQKNRGTRIKMFLVGSLLASKTVRAKMGNRMTKEMMRPYEKMLQTVKPAERTDPQ